MTKPTIGFAGLTHLGLVSAAVAAAKGFSVVGCDSRPDLIQSLQTGTLAPAEPGLTELLQNHRQQLSFEASLDALQDCDVIYLSQDVPTDDAGQSDLTDLTAMLDALETEIPDSIPLVILSQVPPGFTRARACPRLYYQVETLVIGHAVERAQKPERLIVGCEEPDGNLPVALKAYLDEFDCPVMAMRYESAELAKIAVNVCLVASVTTANTLAELCRRVRGDWSEVEATLRLDQRIGPHAYLKPGLGIAGGNLERDLRTVQNLAAEHGVDAGFVDAMTKSSHYHRDWVLRTLNQFVLTQLDNPRLAILGLSYKPGTESLKNSPAVALINQLHPFRLHVYDPVVTAPSLNHPRYDQASAPLDACRDADAVIIMTPWPEFAQLKAHDIAAKMIGLNVIDPFAVLSRQDCEAANLRYHCLHVQPESAP